MRFIRHFPDRPQLAGVSATDVLKGPRGLGACVREQAVSLMSAALRRFCRRSPELSLTLKGLSFKALWASTPTPVFPEEPKTSEPLNNGPITRRQFDRIQVAVWRNTSEPDGSDSSYGSTIVRRCKDANGEWQATSSFTERELPHVKRAADWAEAQIMEAGC